VRVPRDTRKLRTTVDWRGFTVGAAIATRGYRIGCCHTTRFENDAPIETRDTTKGIIEMTISKPGIRSVAVAMTAIGLLHSVSALACGGDWYPEVQIDPRIHGVAQAEKASTKGDYVAAAGSVVRMMPHIESLAGQTDPLVTRAERVLAVAISRSNGKLSLEQQVPADVLSHWLGKTEADRQKNLVWSVNRLRSELLRKKDDPAVMTDLGEALSKLDSGEDEARGLLESLASRDLVASPEGYKALAVLRQRHGDEAGQKLALKRCESMASASAPPGVGRSVQVCESEAHPAS